MPALAHTGNDDLAAVVQRFDTGCHQFHKIVIQLLFDRFDPFDLGLENGLGFLDDLIRRIHVSAVSFSVLYGDVQKYDFIFQ